MGFLVRHGVWVRSLSGQWRIGEDRLCGCESRRVFRVFLVVVGGERLAAGGRAIGSCDCELVAAFLSLFGGCLSRHPFVNTTWSKPGGSRSWRDTD